jgi:hypothetical protein
MKLISKFLEIRNRIDYPLRQLFRWRRGPIRVNNGLLFDNYAFLAEPERTKARQYEQRYFNDYHLEKLKRDAAADNYYENIFYIHMLEEAFALLKKDLPDPIICADIGTSHWFYVQALWSFYTWFQRKELRDVALDGYEVDAFRIYSDFHSRIDHALTHISEIPGIQFIPEDFRPIASHFDVITLFFPFVFEKDALEWGLPSRLHHPEQLVQNAWDSIKPGGVLMIVNQGKDEHDAQLRLCEKLGLSPIVKLRIDPLLYKYDYDRYILGVIK